MAKNAYLFMDDTHETESNMQNGRIPDRVIMEMYRSGDAFLEKKAKELVVTQHARSVYYIIHHLFPTYEHQYMEDMFQCGCIGLLRSLEHYDGSTALITYSRLYVVHEISEFTFCVRNIPSAHYARIQRVISDTENAGLTDEELAQKAGVRVSTIRREQKAMQRTQMTDIDSVQELIGNDGDMEETCIDRMTAEQIFAAINLLPGQEREVVKLRLLDGMKYRDIGNQLGVSATTALAWYRKGICRIREECGF